MAYLGEVFNYQIYQHYQKKRVHHHKLAYKPNLNYVSRDNLEAGQISIVIVSCKEEDHAYIIDPVLSKIIKMKLFVLFTSAVFAARARREQVPSWVNPEEQAQVVTVRKFFDLINQDFLKEILM